MRLFWEVAKRSFRRNSTYRMATAAGAFTNSVFGLIKASVLLAVLDARDTAAGFGPRDAVTFTFVAQGLIVVVSAFGERELAERVRSGDIAIDLSRPIRLPAWYLADHLGKAVFAIGLRGVPPLVMGVLVLDARLPSRLSIWLALPLVLGGAAAVAARWWYLVNLSAFWVTEARGVINLAAMGTSAASGLLLPLQLLPTGLGTICRFSLFGAMIQLPVDVWLGSTPIVTCLATQAAWLAGLTVLANVVTARATRRLEVQGG